MGRGLVDEQDVVLILGSLQVVISVRPYVASSIVMVFLTGHFNVADLPSHTMFSMPRPRKKYVYRVWLNICSYKDYANIKEEVDNLHEQWTGETIRTLPANIKFISTSFIKRNKSVMYMLQRHVRTKCKICTEM